MTTSGCDEGSVLQKPRRPAQTAFKAEIQKIKELSTETSEHIHIRKKKKKEEERWFLDYMIKLFLELSEPVAHCCTTQRWD